VDNQPYCHSTAFDAVAPVLDAMVEALESCGVEVLQYHAESAPGQFEIATGHFQVGASAGGKRGRVGL
jgi:glutamine synthetase